MTWAVAFGCSHTAGTSVGANHCYVQHLENHYGFPFRNRGIPGGNASMVIDQLMDTIYELEKPGLIIIQWPNPIRSTRWMIKDRQEQIVKMNINNSDYCFNEILRQSDKNFYMPWIQSIRVADCIAKIAAIPIINIYLDTLENQYRQHLTQFGIVLHEDLKLPDQTWYFDSAAPDGIHHSEQCHRLWAERLIRIIDANTSR